MHPSAPLGISARPRLVLAEIAERVAQLEPGGRLTVIGLGPDRLAEILGPARGALLMATDGPGTAGAILDRLLDDLAELALDRWPAWHGASEPADTAGAQGLAAVSRPWLRAAAKHAGQGRPPRFRRTARAFELAQLLRAVDPSGLILVAEVDPASPARAGPVIEALGWCAGAGAATVAVLPSAPPEAPPYDRILYGAYEVARGTAPLAERFVPPPTRAHPGSAVERRVEAALARDPELAGLFSGNETVTLDEPGPHPRVDLLCRAHGVVVELDGPEHRAPALFEADRHRDSALLAAGYLVLRLTNRQVETDLARAVEKIRAVIRLRRPPGEMTSR